VRVREIPDWISLDLLGRAVVGATARHLNALSRAILTCLLLFCMECGDARGGRRQIDYCKFTILYPLLAAYFPL
jgi:hypothetical protein